MDFRSPRRARSSPEPAGFWLAHESEALVNALTRCRANRRFAGSRKSEALADSPEDRRSSEVPKSPPAILRTLLSHSVPCGACVVTRTLRVLVGLKIFDFRTSERVETRNERRSASLWQPSGGAAWRPRPSIPPGTAGCSPHLPARSGVRSPRSSGRGQRGATRLWQPAAPPLMTASRATAAVWGLSGPAQVDREHRTRRRATDRELPELTR